MKKSLVALFIIAIVCSFSFAFAARFSDVPSDMWAASQISRWADEKVVVGYEDGTYRPSNLITRAEFATIIVKLFGPIKEADISKYKDISKDDWFYENLSKAVAMGSIEEYNSTSMRPNAYVTRQEAVVILNSVLKFSPARKDAVRDFEDYDEIADYALEDVEVFAERDYIVGYPDGTFRPSETITRAEMATVLERIFKLIITESGTYDCTGYNVNHFVIVKAKDVTLKNADQCNVIFLNDTVKESTKGLTDAQKKNCVVINPGKDSESKTTGRTTPSGGGSSGGGTSTTFVVTIKDNVTAGVPTYAITTNNVTLKDGRSFIVRVNGKIAASGTAKSKTILDAMEEVADKLAPDGDLDRTNRLFNTLYQNKKYTTQEVKDFAKDVVLDMVLADAVTLADGTAINPGEQGKIKEAAGGDDLLAVYENLNDTTKLAIKGFAVNEAEATYEQPGGITYDALIKALNNL